MTLAELIAEKGLTVSSVAQRMDINQVQVMAWVCGEVPDVISAFCLAKALETPMEELYAAILRTPKII